MAEYPADKTVEQEIERLKQSEAVKLSLRERRYNRQRKQYHRALKRCVQQGKNVMQIDMATEMRNHQLRQGLSILRFHEWRGEEMMSQGITEEMLPDLILDNTKVRCEK